MTKMLTIRTPAGRKIAKLVWRDGTVIVECDSGVGFDVSHWVREGLDEWIGIRDEGDVIVARGQRDGVVPRHTPAHAPEFLARLGGHLQSRLGFQTTLEEVS